MLAPATPSFVCVCVCVCVCITRLKLETRPSLAPRTAARNALPPTARWRPSPRIWPASPRWRHRSRLAAAERENARRQEGRAGCLGLVVVHRAALALLGGDDYRRHDGGAEFDERGRESSRVSMVAPIPRAMVAIDRATAGHGALQPRPSGDTGRRAARHPRWPPSAIDMRAVHLALESTVTGRDQPSRVAPYALDGLIGDVELTQRPGGQVGKPRRAEPVAGRCPNLNTATTSPTLAPSTNVAPSRQAWTRSARGGPSARRPAVMTRGTAFTTKASPSRSKTRPQRIRHESMTSSAGRSIRTAGGRPWETRRIRGTRGPGPRPFPPCPRANTGPGRQARPEPFRQ